MGTGIRINGQSCAKEDARISIFDRGFLYGDSVYEVLRTYSGAPFEVDQHLARLEASAARIGMELPVSRDVLRSEVERAHRESENPDSYIRVVVTRGHGPIDLDPSAALEPTYIVVAMPIKTLPPEAYVEGIGVQIVQVVRNHVRAVDPQAKTGNYLNSVMALREARAAGAYEAIMLDAQGRVAEGASSNVFAVVGGVVLTPPIEVGLLAGITRRTVIDVCARKHRRFLEIPLSADNLREADEVFITSSIREVVPVVKVDGLSIGAGIPGEVVTEIRQGYQEYVTEYADSYESTLR